MHSILIFLLLTVSLHATSKEFWVIMHETSNTMPMQIGQGMKNEISLVSFSKEQKKLSQNSGVNYTNGFDYLSSLSNNPNLQLNRVKIGASANISANQNIKIFSLEEVVGVATTPTEEFIIAGYSSNGALLMTKIDTGGNTLYTTTFGDKKYDSIKSIIYLKDGGVLALGSSVTATTRSDIFKSGLGLNDIFVTKFSKNGEILWSKKYGSELNETGVSAVEAEDSSLMVLGSKANSKSQYVTLMKITKNGDTSWIKDYNTESSLTPRTIIKLKDNTFLVSLSEHIGSTKEQIRVLKISADQAILIDKHISTSYSSILKDIKEYPDGSLIGVGEVRDGANTDALVMVLNKSLSLVNQEHYGHGDYDVFRSVTLLDGAHAAAVGIHTNEKSHATHIWVTKLNRDGTLVKTSGKK